MHTLLFRTLVLTFISSAILGAPLARAQDPAVVPNGAGAARQPAVAVSDATTLIATKSSSGATDTHLTFDGLTPLDTPRVLNCPGNTGTCRIEINQNVVMAGGSTSTVFGICTKVDGVFISPCVNLGYAPPIRQTKNYVQFQSVACGNHTVQTFVYTNRGGVASAYGITYHIYK